MSVQTKRSAAVGSAPRTLKRTDLANALYRYIGLSRSESAAMVEAVLGEICDAIGSRESVKLSGFGSFIVRAKQQRLGRNPKTRVEATIAARHVVVFKPSGVLKARINGRAG